MTLITVYCFVSTAIVKGITDLLGSIEGGNDVVIHGYILTEGNGTDEVR